MTRGSTFIHSRNNFYHSAQRARHERSMISATREITRRIGAKGLPTLCRRRRVLPHTKDRTRPITGSVINRSNRCEIGAARSRRSARKTLRRGKKNYYLAAVIEQAGGRGGGLLLLLVANFREPAKTIAMYRVIRKVIESLRISAGRIPVHPFPDKLSRTDNRD